MDRPLTDKQKLYCDYRMDGLDGNDAAIKAGYKPTDRGNHSLVPARSVAVQRELAIRSDTELLNIAPMVIQTLRDLLKSKNETVRLSAARDLADRIGLGKDVNSQQKLEVNINLGNDGKVAVLQGNPPPFLKKFGISR